MVSTPFDHGNKAEPMDYFSILELDREPFSNSPDPTFFYGATPHLACLQQLELSIRLKRGLNVVMGRVGTGKTTISRELVRRFDRDDTITVHLVLDPSYSSGEEFLQGVEEMLLGESLPSLSVWQRKERIKNALFEIGVANHGTVVLLVDEGQKLSIDCLEIIREFLNYETNTQKLLQVVIFAQEEFDHLLASMENFQDRINCIIRLGPMSFKDMRSMIRFRLEQSSSTGSVPTFSLPALWYMYRVTQGYPRKVINIAHRVLLTIIVQGRNRVTYKSVAAAVGKTIPARRSGSTSRWGLRCLVVCLFLVLAYQLIDRFEPGISQGLQTFFAGSDEKDRSSSTNASTESVQRKHNGLGSMDQAHAREVFGPTPVEGTNNERVDQSHDIPAAVRKADQPLEPNHFEIMEPSEPSDKESAPVLAAANESVQGTANVVPKMLGTIVVQKDDTIFRMIRRVYNVGEVEAITRFMQKLLAVNPSLSVAPDSLEVGTRVTFPTPKPVDRSLADDRFWVCLAQTDSLERAYRLLARFRTMYFHLKEIQNSKYISLVISRAAGDGFRFSLLLDTSFVSRSEAQKAMETPPNDWWKDPAVITSKFFAKKVLFSTLP